LRYELDAARRGTIPKRGESTGDEIAPGVLAKKADVEVPPPFEEKVEAGRVITVVSGLHAAALQ